MQIHCLYFFTCKRELRTENLLDQTILNHNHGQVVICIRNCSNQCYERQKHDKWIMLRSLLYIDPPTAPPISPKSGRSELNSNSCAPEAAATLTMSQKAFPKRSTNGSQPAITKNNAPNKSRETCRTIRP